VLAEVYQITRLEQLTLIVSPLTLIVTEQPLMHKNKSVSMELSRLQHQRAGTESFDTDDEEIREEMGIPYGMFSLEGDAHLVPGTSTSRQMTPWLTVAK
jgi:hypothetical protein